LAQLQKLGAIVSFQLQ